MSKPLRIDLFAEDRGHEMLLKPLLERLARERDRDVEVSVRSARGGHGRAIAELKLYQNSLTKKIGSGTLPDILVVAIDGNCSGFAEAQRTTRSALIEEFPTRTVVATPDPHIEKWYLADLEAFHQVVGASPSVGKQKCKRDVYKGLLADAVRKAGHPPTLGGIEFARELAEVMDFFRASKSDRSLKHFLDEIAARLEPR